MSLDLSVKNGILAIGRKNHRVQVIDGHDDEMELARILPARLFVTAWARVKKYTKEGETDVVIIPDLDVTLATVMADMKQKYEAGSVAMLKLAHVVHRDIGAAIKVLEKHELHYVLGPPSICLFREGARLHSKFIGVQEVELNDVEEKTFAKWDNDLEKITKPLRGRVPASQISAALKAFGVPDGSWMSTDGRIVPYADKKEDSEQEEASEEEDQEDEASGQEDDQEEALEQEDDQEEEAPEQEEVSEQEDDQD
jgi:hypothetical protein